MQIYVRIDNIICIILSIAYANANDNLKKYVNILAALAKVHRIVDDFVDSKHKSFSLGAEELKNYLEGNENSWG